ncbi:grancalcin-like [Clavelina lepadiformis]|uniref:EF-hand domain-containing protein n=1 Tax=Clavelina lepadiformis TaxID=159417 RepID=A0ABP0G1S8_CLALP
MAMEDPIMRRLYDSVNWDQDNGLSVEEMQRGLTESQISGIYQPFSQETTRILCVTLDRNRDSKINFEEFCEVFRSLNGWKNVFVQHDRDRSGTMEGAELHRVLIDLGYHLSPQAMGIILRRYSNNNKISFDGFVGCCISLKHLTDGFRFYDKNSDGNATLHYYQYLHLAFSL